MSERATLNISAAIDFTVTGAAGRAVVGSTLAPPDNGAAERAVALTVHGWTGHKDRNVVPAAASLVRRLGCVSHRITLGHAGVEAGGDDITDADAFERDSLDNATADVRATLDAIDTGELAGRGLPLVLIGHSRGGSQVIRIAATAAREGWSLPPTAVVALAPVSRHGYLHPAEREQFERDGFVERPCARAPGGRVRMGPSWFQHWLDEPERDHFAEDVRDSSCPVLVIHGEADTSIGLEHAERIERLADERSKDRWTFTRVPGADHNFGAKGFLKDGLTYDVALMSVVEGAMRDFVDRALAPT